MWNFSLTRERAWRVSLHWKKIPRRRPFSAHPLVWRPGLRNLKAATLCLEQFGASGRQSSCSNKLVHPSRIYGDTEIFLHSRLSHDLRILYIALSHSSLQFSIQRRKWALFFIHSPLKITGTPANGVRAHYVMVSKIPWKPFWLAIQLYLQNDWTGWQNGVNDDVCELAHLSRAGECACFLNESYHAWEFFFFF